MTKTPTLEALQRNFDDRVAVAEKDLADWKAKLEKNPLHAFEWAERAMAAAAELDLFTGLAAFVGRVRAGETVMTPAEVAEAILKDAREATLNVAKNPPRSTSVTSNLVAQARARAQAELLDFWGFGRQLQAMAQGEAE